MTIEEKIAVRITPTKNGPFKVEFLDNLSNRHGTLEVKQTMYLCRCGGSSNKPFCDSTHLKNGFNSSKLDGRVEDKRDNYEGKEVTIHDNRGICAHIGFCTDELPAVFRQGQEPWVDPDGASGDRIIAQVRRCPSGALSYSLDNIEYRDREGEPRIFVSHNGPYFVTGRPVLVETDRGEGASTEHFALCRCGGSKNKPFCDGTHWYINFTDDKNQIADRIFVMRDGRIIEEGSHESFTANGGHYDELYSSCGPPVPPIATSYAAQLAGK